MSMIAAAMIVSVRAQTACRSRGFERIGDRPKFLHAGLSQGADPHIGGRVKTVESPTSA
jgi:hypothetical protein